MGYVKPITLRKKTNKVAHVPVYPKAAAYSPVAGLSVRADFEGRTLSSDFGPMILRGVDRHIGLTERLSGAFDDRRHRAYVTHPLRELMAQRIYQIACGY